MIYKTEKKVNSYNKKYYLVKGKMSLLYILILYNVFK